MKFLGKLLVGVAVAGAALAFAVLVASVYDEDEHGRWYLG